MSFTVYERGVDNMADCQKAYSILACKEMSTHRNSCAVNVYPSQADIEKINKYWVQVSVCYFAKCWEDSARVYPTW